MNNDKSASCFNDFPSSAHIGGVEDELTIRPLKPRNNFLTMKKLLHFRCPLEKYHTVVKNTIIIPEETYCGSKGDVPSRDCGPVYYLYGQGASTKGQIISIYLPSCHMLLRLHARNYDDVVYQLSMLCTQCHYTQALCKCNDGWQQQFGKWTLSSDKNNSLPRNVSKFSIMGRFMKAVFVQSDMKDLTFYLQGGPKGPFESIFEDDKISTIVKLSEDVVTLIFQLRNSRTVEESSVAIGAFIRSVTGVSLFKLTFKLTMMLSEAFDFYSKTCLQDGSEKTTAFERLWDNYSKYKNTAFADKLFKVLDHIIAHSLYHKLGIEVDPEKFKRLEEKSLRPNFKDALSMLEAVGNLLNFVLKQGRQFMLTGDINSFFVSGGTVSEWMVSAKKIKANFEFLSNPDAVDINIHEYLHTLSTLIKQGNSLIKIMPKNSLEWRLASTTCIDLESLEKRYLSLASSLSMRRQPFGIVLYGSPGIGKSHLTNMISHFYASRFDLNTKSDFTFYHSSEEEFFTNFRSYMHTIILDDVAQHIPDRVQGVDKSLSTLIKIFNNMPFSPPQAALDDKGKTPMLCELGIVTTNVLDLNISHYYSKSYAVMRRLPIHIEPIVKKEFRFPGKLALDPSKTTGEIYADYWDFVIREPNLFGDMKGHYKETRRFSTLKDLFEWLGPIMDKHRKNQLNLVENSHGFEDVAMCATCRTPKDICACTYNPPVELQSAPSSVVVDNESIPFIQNDEDIFLGPIENPTPWRIYDLPATGSSRYFTHKLAIKFCEAMSERYPADVLQHIRNYAFCYLPDLMAHGYNNAVILEDFNKYLRYCQDQEDVFAFSEACDNSVPSTPQNLLLRVFMYLYFEVTLFRHAFNRTMEYSRVRKFAYRLFDKLHSSTSSRTSFMASAGRQIDFSLLGNHPLVILASVASIMWILQAIHDTYRKSISKKKYERTYFPEASSLNEGANAVRDRIISLENELFWRRRNLEMFEARQETKETQGQLSDFGSVPVYDEDEMTENVWITKERTVTSLDFMDTRATSLEALNKSLVRSCVIVRIATDTTEVSRVYMGRAILLNSETILLNFHAVPKVNFSMTVFLGKNLALSQQINFCVDLKQITSYSNRDLAFIKTKALPMLYSNIISNFPLDSFNGVYDGYYLIRQDDGSFDKLTVNRIRLTVIKQEVEMQYFSTQAYIGTPTRPTTGGECGAPLFMDTGYGPILVGMHFMYDPMTGCCYATKLSASDVLPFKTEVDIQCTEVDLRGFELVHKKKSYIDFHTEGGVIYHGESNIRGVRPKSRAVPTEISAHLEMQPPCGDFKFVQKFSKPLMHTWIPQQIALQEYLVPAYSLNEVNIARCAAVLLDNILKNLPEKELRLIHPVPLEVAVNGMPGMAYVDAMKRSTSMGFPYHTTKRKFLDILESDIWQDGVEFSPEIIADIEAVMEGYRNGKRFHPVFSANLKDEVVSLKKFFTGKTRVFFSCPYQFLIVVKMMFAGFCRVVQRNWKIFHCVIGVNCGSREWKELYDILTRFGKTNFIAGDFKGFDKKFCILFMRWAFWIIKEICSKAGFSKDDMTILECIEADLTNPTVNWFGIIITLLGGEVSGHQLTTVFNCFMCQLYIMYCYSTIYPIEEFHEYVVMTCLGDDHVVNVSSERPLFTHTFIKDVLENAGVGYTMADKDAPSVPYIPVEDVTFLKRTFRYHTELGTICAPLDKDSIMKMLMYHVISKTCSESEALAQAMVSASMESFFHGREFFDYIEDCLDRVPKSSSLEEHIKAYPRFTWEQNIDRFFKRSLVSAASLPGRNQKETSDGSYCTLPNMVLQGSVRMGLSRKFARAFPEDRIYGRTKQKFKRESKDMKFELTHDPDKKQLSKSNTQLNNNDVAEDIVVDNEECQQTTTFANESSPEIFDLSTPHDEVADLIVIQSDLRSYLSRPAKILNYTWSIGAAPGILTSFNPWALFFNIPSISNKLQNFRFMRCNLHLKFVINASPFYYGAIGAFYQPLATDTGDRLSTWTTSAPGQQVLLSQRNKVWLNPQNISTQEMVLPFLHYNQFVDLSLLANLTNMGKIDLAQYTDLRSANGVVAGGVTINVYAWASEVDLAGATSTAILQGKTEYKPNGQISGPASTIAGIAGKLKSVPVIGPFAAATETVSSALGSVASFFGYTNVPVIDDVMPYKPTAFHTLASSTISEPINKLSLQPKQEIAISNAFGDSGSDPLMIKNFVERESFLTGTLWTTVNNENDILFTTGVRPGLKYATTGSGYYNYYHTPMAYVNEMFQFWSGDIIFRFKLIKSKYHKGRLNICWDVGNFDYATMPTVGDPTVFNVVVDLETEDEIEVRVPWTQAAPVLACYKGNSFGWSNGSAPTGALTLSNGMLQVRVLNALTAPTASSSIDVLVFVRGAENLKFSAPTDINPKLTNLQLQGKIVEFSRTADQSPHKFKEVFGEDIVSLRELLHRQSLAWTQVQKKQGTGSDWAGVTQFQAWTLARIPRPFGYSANAWESASGTLVPGSTFGFNFVRNHPLNFVASCFVGLKGSTNVTINSLYQGAGTTAALPKIMVSRTTSNQGFTPKQWASNATNGTSQMMASVNVRQGEDSGAAGMALTNQHTQAGISVNLPYYAPAKFQIINNVNLYSNSVVNAGTYGDQFIVNVRRGTSLNTPDYNLMLDVLYGTGPDFDLVYFLNVPMLSELVSFPAAATGD
jgi:hypothetical protein